MAHLGQYLAPPVPGGCARAHPLEKPKTYLHDALATEPRNDSLTPTPGLGSIDECLD
jgi:hypothetical protein